VGLFADIRVDRDGFRAEAELHVPSGSTLALLGPNGAGKSTVVEALAGTLALSSGTIRLDGASLEDRPTHERPVGVLFQDPLLFPHLSAVDNVAFSLRARGLARGPANERANELLAQLAPTVRPDARPRSISGGEQQRVALARALIAEPRLLLLDEPLAAVDVGARAELRSLLREVIPAFDGACIIVAHDPLDALTLADTVAILEEGVVVQRGSPRDIREAPRSPYAAELVGVNLFVGTLRRGEGGIGLLGTEAGDIAVAWPPGATDPTDDVIAVLRPADVALHLHRPEGSPRNVLHGRIDEVATTGGRSRVRVASSPPIVAEVTTGSVQRLSLAVGSEVWASFKAVEVRLELPRS
jgi:molybdate transport system ATP-binding protein